LLARLQALHHLAIGVLSEQAAADRRDRCHRRIEIDEGVLGRALLRPGGRLLIAGLLIGVVDVGHAEKEPAHRAVAEQGLPILDIAPAEIDAGYDWRGSSRRGSGLAEAARLYDLQRRAQDAVADHQHRHGRTANDVWLRLLGGAGGDGADVRAAE